MQKSLSITVFVGALFAMQLPCGAATPVLTTLYSFPGIDGEYPEASLVLNNGNLIGTTYTGGVGWGTVFALSPPAQSGGAWTIHQLYAFTGGADGANPRAGVVLNPQGVIFGTTEQGGASGYGTVFSLTPAGGGKYTQSVVYSFTGLAGDGAYPEAGLILSSKSGYLYGTTYGGGTAGYGTVFALTPPVAPSTAWTEKVLYSFAGAPLGCGTGSNPACDGENPLGAVTLTSTGVLYGTTYNGGGAGWGTVFELTQSAGLWTEKVLYSFNGAPSAVNGGNACGTSGDPTPCDGGAPEGNVALNTATGALYGTTTLGGKSTGCPQGGYEQGCGVVFQLTPPVAPSTAWTESLLYIFAGPPQDGMLPSANLVYAPTGGTLYGTTFAGASTTDHCFPGSYLGCGMAYFLSPPVAPSTTWTKTNLAIFNGDNGGGPNGVILSPAGGLLYGTTYEGGLAGGYGSIFQLTF
ncbi:MAG: choice-of-anchor tandem repeat GloVer-containing protein [Bryobacteraceae bacterium]|jgi:uncharacterized repeat protein (TIGR03803 family)